MYKCEHCGNTRYLTEQNIMETYIEINDVNEVVNLRDKFLGCERVVCSECGHMVR